MSTKDYSVESFTTRLEEMGLTGKGKMWQCPNHDDSTPSLAVERGKRNPVVFRCFAGCSQDSVLRAMGLSHVNSKKLKTPYPKHSVNSSSNVLNGGRPLVTRGRKPKIMDLERGKVVPVPVARPVPAGASPRVREVAAEVARVAGLYAAVGDARAVPLATGWLAERLGWRGKDGTPNKMAVSRALRWLEREGWLRCVGTLARIGKKLGTKCFAVPLVRKLVAERAHEWGQRFDVALVDVRLIAVRKRDECLLRVETFLERIGRGLRESADLDTDMPF